MFGSIRLPAFCLLGVIFGVAPLGATGQVFYRPTEIISGIPTPEEVLGYPLGERLTPHHRMVDYLRRVADASPRVSLETYGTTPEGRPLLLLTVADADRNWNLDDLQKTYRELADSRHTSESKAHSLIKDIPISVWLSFNIHGNESSSTEAAMALVYTLAASKDAEVVDLLRKTVVLIDPCLNPDGRERYVSWFNGVTGSLPDPLKISREHQEPWPGGRYNHYLFDLNRDWAWLVQPESRDRIRAYLEWRPQVHVDFHEMWSNSTYFFFPPERPVHTLYPPSLLTWERIFGQGNAKVFDARGWRYFTAEDFDLFYPGYGDSWPSFQGAVGMTYEQAGHGAAGITVRRDDETLLTLRDRAEHHYTTALATVRTAADNREAKLLDYYRFFEIPDRLPVAAYVFPPGGDPGRTAELVDLLMANGAEVYETTKPQGARGLVNFENRTFRGSVPAGTYVVPVDQPLHRFLRAVLEPEPDIPDTMFYDISAWSLPLAFGVEAYTSANSFDGDLRRVTVPPRPQGALEDTPAAYAYLLSSQVNATFKCLGDLLDQDVRVHFATKAFTVGGREFPAGSLVVFRKDNPANLATVLKEIALNRGAHILGVSSGLTDKGPDLGSDHVQYLRPFHVGLVSGDPVDPTSLGACWFLLDRQYHFPHSLVQAQDLSAALLKDLDVLVFPDDGAGGYAYSAELDSSQVAALDTWIHGGGVFVGLGGGAFFATRDRGGLASTGIVDPEADLTEEERTARETARKLETLQEREKRRWMEHLPGTIFKVRVDPQSPVAFGYRGTTQVLITDDSPLELGPPGTNVAVYPESPRVAGYVDPDQEARLVNTPYLVAEPSGRGYVVLYAGDPNFRLFWFGLNRLFLNSLCFLPSL